MPIKQAKRALKKTVLKQWREVPELHELINPLPHSAHIRRHRARIIASRVGLLSLLFAITIPLWIVIDFMAFDWPLWGILSILRLGAAFVFWALYMGHSYCKSLAHAYLALGAMLAVPPIFYLVAHPFLLAAPLSDLGEILTSAYSLLPLIVVAGLSIFPLTALEVISAGFLVVMVVVLGAAQTPDYSAIEFINTLWLTILVLGVSLFSGMSQLHYMISLINQASRDVLTGAFTRRSGEEYLDLQFRITSRTDAPFSLLFIDIDKFKSVNDDFGHEQGDMVLQETATNLQNCLRRSDLLIRWGGEEFVILLPNTKAENVTTVLNRISQQGLGTRPDGSPITVSVGVSERSLDNCDDWLHMIEAADHRMYKAKEQGRNQSRGPLPALDVKSLIKDMQISA